MNKHFEKFKTGLSFDYSNTPFPSRLICAQEHFELSNDSSTYFGFVLEGYCELMWQGHKLNLSSQMYFSVPGGLSSGSLAMHGKVILFERSGYRGLPIFGGPTEVDGRLAYIDNSRASILVSPARVGDPVLNLLVFPPNIEQSSHLHPSLRLGLVIKGHGQCRMERESIPLEVGTVFALEAGQIHGFNSGSEGLSVIAYHPDSDVGPTDEVHPMKSRTYLVNEAKALLFQKKLG